MSGIRLKYNNKEYIDRSVIELDSSKTLIKIEVGVNGDYNCNDFNISIPSNKWIKIKRIRNIIDLIIESNNDEYRVETIIFSHKLNPLNKIELEIVQKTPEYSLFLTNENGDENLNEKEIIFDTLTEQTDVNKEIKSVYVKSKNGMPFISNIREYAKFKNTDEDYVRVKYDMGLQIEIQDNKINIINYGKSNLYYDFYYEIPVKNRKDVYNESIIRVRYNNNDNFGLI
jgi:hypothetical protein